VPIVNCVTELLWLFYNVHETLTVIVRNVYLFYVSFASLGLGLGLVCGFVSLRHARLFDVMNTMRAKPARHGTLRISA